MTAMHQQSWPVLSRYDQQHLNQIALPLGGIGTGTVSLGGRGDLRDWEIMNRAAKGYTPKHAFFALYARPAGGQAVACALEGQIGPPYEGSHGSTVPNHNLPRFRTCSFAAAYPFGQVMLSDPDVPVHVRIEAFNPLVPADSDASGIPIAILRYVLHNQTDQPVTAAVCGSVENFIGTDGKLGKPHKNTNTWMQTGGAAPLQGIFMQSDGVSREDERWGTMALATTSQEGVTYRSAWPNLSWGDMLLDFWDDWSTDGQLEEHAQAGLDNPISSLAVKVELPPQAEKSITFLLGWHFPNRQSWTPTDNLQGPAINGCVDLGAKSGDRVGNYYTTQYRDSWDVVVRTAPNIAHLEAATLSFVSSFCDSDLPTAVQEAALYNLSTLRSQTCFRTEDGHFYGWEGCCDQDGCCHGSCTHVWNYEQAVPFLFGDLARSMREIEFRHMTDDQGLMSFRVNLPLSRATEYGIAAADGQMGCLMKLYRDWQLSGDEALLGSLWPKARKALEFCWIPGGWDADRDGVMEGCQHNTMDVEYFGPNPQMGLWYLGALRASEEMARHMGELDFARTCHDLFEQGSLWLDQHLFNGEYYEHEIRPPLDATSIAPGLRHQSMGAKNLTAPELQLGSGCLVDQLVGQYMAHVCGLGYLVGQDNIHMTLRSLMKYNFKQNLFGHFNHLRTFAINDEPALVMCTYPRGRRPLRPFPYFNEVMTGFEYTAAVHMLYEGQTAEGLRCIESIRARYDGQKRNPFDEAECGHHYARAMASWAAVLALSGFHYSGVTQTLEFAALGKPAQHFWSNGYAWGTCKQTPAADGVSVVVSVVHGALQVRRLLLTGVGAVDLDQPRSIAQGESMTLLVSKA